MNKKLKNKLFNYNTNNINKLNIYYGKTIISNKNIIFNKEISSQLFNTLFSTISSKNYNNVNLKQTIYNINSNYLNLNTKKHTINSNINNIVDDTNLYVYYYQKDCDYTEFPLSKDYNIITQTINKFIVNNEISILFINNNQIKIEILVNHNIDNSIKILDNLFTISI
jgi:hypothetical protein